MLAIAILGSIRGNQLRWKKSFDKSYASFSSSVPCSSFLIEFNCISLDYQPLFGKMSPHSSHERVAGRVRFPLLVWANHVTACRFSSGKVCRRNYHIKTESPSLIHRMARRFRRRGDTRRNSRVRRNTTFCSIVCCEWLCGVERFCIFKDLFKAL